MCEPMKGSNIHGDDDAVVPGRRCGLIEASSTSRFVAPHMRTV